MRVLVCGSRTYDDADLMRDVLHRLWKDTPFTCLIEGGARGADTVARQWADSIMLKVETYKADWKTYGAAAGPIRNAIMLQEGKPDLVVAFPNQKLDASAGTRDMVQRAKAKGVRCIVVGRNDD